MPKYKRIPGVESLFTEHQIKVLIDYFQCKNLDELRLAALRYESLFFMFCHEDDGIETFPGDHMSLALALAGEFAFANFRKTDEELRILYREKPKRKPGRKKKEPIGDDILERFQKERQVVSTDEAAAERLVFLGEIKQGPKPRKAKTILRYIQKAEKERILAEAEREARYRQMCEDASEIDFDAFEAN